MPVRGPSLERGTGLSALPHLAAGVPADEAEVGDARRRPPRARPAATSPSAASSATRVSRHTTGTVVRRSGSGVPASRPEHEARPPRRRRSRPSGSLPGGELRDGLPQLLVGVRRRHRTAPGTSSGIGIGPARLEVDEDERLVRGDEQRRVGHLEGRELEGHARPPDARDPDVDLELVVEAGRREVLDVVRPHHELAARLAGGGGRASGGTRRGRGRSTGCSGRSRRSPARRCPRSPTRVRVEKAYSPLTSGSPRAPRRASAPSAPPRSPRG